MTISRKHQLDAQNKYGYGAIRLRREGDFAIVEIEYDKKFIEVIKEHVDGNFYHIVEPLGIEGAIKNYEN